MEKRRTYTSPSNAVFRAGQKKANVTKAIAVLNRISVDAMGRAENTPLLDSLGIALYNLKEYQIRLIDL